MLGQVGFEGKGFAAVAAGKRLVRRVCLDVGPQVALVRKALGTDVAGERLLAGVGADVSLQQPRPGEVLAAVGAGAAGTVRPQVHGQGGGAAVDARAVRALASAAGAGSSGTVRLAVTGQVTAGAVGLAALLALVGAAAAAAASAATAAVRSTNKRIFVNY